jgi:hypothetical protein
MGQGWPRNLQLNRLFILLAIKSPVSAADPGRDVYPGSEFFSIPDPGTRVKKIPGSASALKNLSILT